MFYSVITDVLDIQEGDIVYTNKNVNFPIKYAALFIPSEQKKWCKRTADALSKLGMKVGKRYEPKNKIELFTTLQHGRSGVLPSLIKFSDVYNNKYGWVNFKGIGNWLWGDGGFAKNTKKLAPFCDELGHLGYIFAKRDQVLSDKLIALGFRTSVVLFIIRLRELPGKDGRMHDVEEFLAKYKLPVGSTPVIMARGMRNHLRIVDFMAAEPKDKDKFLESAILDVRNRDKNKSVKDKTTFLIWFAETIAEQLSILYSVRAYHSYLTVHNITMAAEIVDLDSLVSNLLMDIDKKVTPEEMSDDVKNGWTTLGKLMDSVGLEKNEVHKMLLQYYLFKYLAQIVELRFGPNRSMVEDIKRDLDMLHGRIVNKEQTEGLLKENQVYHLVKDILSSIDKGYDSTKKVITQYTHGY